MSLGATLSAVSVASICTVMFGFCVGYISFYITFDFQNLVCPQYTTQSACEAPSFASCIWTAKPGAQVVTNSTSLTPSCKYSDYDVVYCPQYSESSCGTVSSCQFNYGTNGCERAVGMTVSQIGYFASSFSVGAFFGSWLAILLLDRKSFRFTWFVCVAAVLLSCIIHAIARTTNLLPLMAFAQGLAGLGVACMRYVVAIYTFQVAAPRANVIMAVLQPLQEVAGLISALYTYFVMPTKFDSDPNFESRIYAYDALIYFMILAACVAGVFMHEPPPPEREDGNHNGGAAPLPAAGILKPLLHHPKQMLLGLALCVLFLLEPYLALQAFIPLYSTALIGVDSALSVLVFALIATPCGIIALIVRLNVTTSGKPLAVTGGSVMAVATACLGIVAYPGVVSSASAKHGLAIFFIVVAVGAMETCIGTTFYALALQSQPPEVRTAGGAFMNSMINVFALLMTSLFPTAVTSISGGPKANQMFGFASCMFFLAAVSVVCCIVIGLFLRIYEVEDVKQSSRRDSVRSVHSDAHSDSGADGRARHNVLEVAASPDSKDDWLDESSSPVEPSQGAQVEMSPFKPPPTR